MSKVLIDDLVAGTADSSQFITLKMYQEIFDAIAAGDFEKRS